MSKFSLSSLMNKVPQQPLSISIFYIQPPLYKEGKKMFFSYQCTIRRKQSIIPARKDGMPFFQAQR